MSCADAGRQTYGKYEPLAEDDERVYCFLKSHDRQTLLVVVNFSPSEIDFHVPLEKDKLAKARPVTSNYPLDSEGGKRKPEEVDRLTAGAEVRLRVYEAVVYEL